MPESRRRLEGKSVIVTGATGGVGQEIARALAAEGAHLALIGRRTGLLRAVTASCLQLRTKAAFYKVELLRDMEIGRLRARVIRDFGGVDILIHCAGVIALADVATASLDDFDRQYRCNVRTPFALTQGFLPSLIAREGQIVFINSTAGLQAGRGIAQYSATKHALKALADSLRQEVNPYGVRVLSVYLGRTATPMQAKVHQVEGKDYHPEQLIQPRQVAQMIADALAVGREAEITDLSIRPMRKSGSPGLADAR